MPSGNDLLNAVLTGLGIGGLFAVIALGLSLVFGVMRLMNLAHGEFIVLGAYIVYYLGTSPASIRWSRMLIAAPAVALLAYPLQHYALSPVMSRGAEAPLLITFGVSVVLQNLFIVAFTADVRSLNASYAQANFELLGVTLPGDLHHLPGGRRRRCWARPTSSSRAQASAAASVRAPRTPSPQRSWASTSSACTP